MTHEPDPVGPAVRRLAAALTPPPDAAERVTARVERRRRRRTTSMAVVSVVAVVGGVGLAGQLAGGSGAEAPAVGDPAVTSSPSSRHHVVPRPVSPCRPARTCRQLRQTLQDLSDLTLTYDEEHGVLSTRRAIGLVRARSARCDGAVVRRSVADVFAAGAPTRAGAVADERRPGEEVFYLSTPGRELARLGQPGRARVELELFDGFAGWVWLSSTTCRVVPAAGPTPRTLPSALPVLPPLPTTSALPVPPPTQPLLPTASTLPSLPALPVAPVPSG